MLHSLNRRASGTVYWIVAMLSIGWRRRDVREVLGQLTRIIAASLFTRLWVPVGNTGGASFSATKPMDLPPDLLELMREDR